MGIFRIYGGVNTSAPTQIVQSSATTWGALKAELLEKGIMNSNMAAAIKENQVGLAIDTYVLPTGIGTGRNGERTNDYDFTVVLTASKMKSGGTVNLNEVERTLLVFRQRLHEEVDTLIDDLIDDLNSDGLDIEQTNTYEVAENERVATTTSRADCPDCDELVAMQRSING